MTSTQTIVPLFILAGIIIALVVLGSERPMDDEDLEDE